MKVIEERDERTIRRKLAKKRFDKIITLSKKREKSETVRLLDEGAVMMSDDTPACYIVKGTLEKALAGMPDDYTNYIDLGHIPFETFPITLGEMKKSDLHLVDIGNGRNGLDVDVKLNYDNPIVQALQLQPFELAVSARFTYAVNHELTEAVTELLGNYVEVIDDISIINYAIVGEPGNVNSDGLKLKGKNMNIESLEKALKKAEGNEMNLEALSEAIDEVIGETSEESEDNQTDEAVGTDEGSDEAESVDDVDTSDTEDDTSEDSEDNSEENSEENLTIVLDRVEELTNRITELEEENRKLQETLNAKKEVEKKFINQLKNAKISVANKEERKVTGNQSYTDGIGSF